MKRQRHHLDKRAPELLGRVGELPTLLSPRQVAEFLGVGRLWLMNGRRLGYGPKFTPVDSRGHYRRDDLASWLRERKSHFEERKGWRSPGEGTSRESSSETCVPS